MIMLAAVLTAEIVLGGVKLICVQDDRRYTELSDSFVCYPLDRMWESPETYPKPWHCFEDLIFKDGFEQQSIPDSPVVQ